MPELPEVETIRRDLNAIIVGQKIAKIIIRDTKAIKGTNATFKNKVIDQKIIAINRRGKLLIISLSNNYFLIVHLRMTGQIFYRKKTKVIGGGHSTKKDHEQLPHKHTHLIIHLANQGTIYYNDIRKFGYWQVVNRSQLEKIKGVYGPEPLETAFSLRYWLELCDKYSKKNLKAILLDQTKIAGIGNIYADEICFSAKVKPTRVIKSLTKSELKLLFLAIKKIIKAGVKYRGTTFSDYRDASGNKGNYLSKLKVYGRKGQSCIHCGEALIKVRFLGRGTHFCPKCQY